MQHNKNYAGSPSHWLNHAVSDMNLAKIGNSPGILLENLCFHAQQSVEKALKAALIHYNIEFPKTHNIKTLLDILSNAINIPNKIADSAALTDYAVITRYPGNYEKVSEDEYREAVIIAESVLEWVKSIIDY